LLIEGGGEVGKLKVEDQKSTSSKTTCYRAVVFDLFGTLIPPFPGTVFEKTLAAMAKTLGADYADFKRIWDDETWFARATGQFATVKANIEFICTSLKVDVSPQQVEQATQLRYAFSSNILHPRPDAVDTLRKSHSLGLRHALITDCSVEISELWDKTPLAAWIDVPIFSCSVGMKKPHSEIYHLASQGVNVAPKDCLYVGDGSSHELQGALQVGMDAVLIAPPEEESMTTEAKEWATWTGKRIARLSDLIPILQNMQP
jgi:putative hydrolase of the HAD superfamily